MVPVRHAVLGGNGPEEAPLDDHVHLYGAGVHVRRVEAAAVEEADGDGSALADQSWKGGAIGANGAAALALDDAEGAAGVGKGEDGVVV